MSYNKDNLRFEKIVQKSCNKFLFIYLLSYLFIYLFTFIYLSIYLFIYLFTYSFIYLRLSHIFMSDNNI